MSNIDNLTDRARKIFDAILGEGDVFAIHNGDEVKLKTVARTGDKLVGIIATNSGGVKTIDISNDEVVRIVKETICAGGAEIVEE